MWKEKYEKVLKNICYANLNDFPIKKDLEKPSFYEIEYLNDDAPLDALYRFALDEEQASEDDYKAFIKYIASYIDVSIDELLDMADGKPKAFDTFEQPKG